MQVIVFFSLLKRRKEKMRVSNPENEVTASFSLTKEKERKDEVSKQENEARA